MSDSQIAAQLAALNKPAAPKMTRIPMATAASQLDANSGTKERLVNLFAEPAAPKSTSELVLRNTPGLSTAFTVGTGPVHVVTNDSATAKYIVSGTRFYRYTQPSGAPTITDMGDIGALPTTATGATPYHYSVADSAQFVLACAPPNLFAAQLTDATIHAVSTGGGSAIPAASAVAFVGAYFVVTIPDNAQFFVSKGLDPSTYDALDFATAETGNNILLCPVSHLGMLWLMGQAGIEVWSLSGAADFPFAREPGGFIPQGVFAARSVAVADNSIFFLSTTLAVMRTVSYRVERVSTDAIEGEFRDYFTARGADVSFVSALSYSIEGKEFYAITLQASGDLGRTWTFNCATQLWFEQSSATDAVGRWRANSGAVGGFLGDALSGSLFQVSDVIPNDNGVQVARVAILPPVFNATMRGFMSRFELDCERGSGPVYLEWTDDDGATWKGGRFLTLSGSRAATTRLGSFHKRSYRMTFPSTHMRIYGAYGLIEAGSS